MSIVEQLKAQNPSKERPPAPVPWHLDLYQKFGERYMQSLGIKVQVAKPAELETERVEVRQEPEVKQEVIDWSQRVHVVPAAERSLVSKKTVVLKIDQSQKTIFDRYWGNVQKRQNGLCHKCRKRFTKKHDTAFVVFKAPYGSRYYHVGCAEKMEII